MLAYDSLDDRRELVVLLNHLPPAARVGYLAWCCSHARNGSKLRPVPARSFAGMAAAARRCDRASDRLTTAVYLDVLTLAAQYGLDLTGAALALGHWVRRGGPPAAPGRGPSPAPARTPGSTGSARRPGSPRPG